MSTLAVVAEVLREVAPRALKARQIVELAGSRLPTASKTPETVVSRDLALAIRDRGASSRFLRVGRGKFVLKEALTTALYNVSDAYAARWTRNLIAAGEVAAGVVDERSLRDLTPADVAGYRQFHAFGGIGVWSRALRDAGWPDDAHVWTGICHAPAQSAPDCKPKALDGQQLWSEWYRLIAACRPALIFGGQVSSTDNLAWLDTVRADLENADYTLRVLDIPAACVGAPHARHELYFAACARGREREILDAPWLHDRRLGDGGCSHGVGGTPDVLGGPGTVDGAPPKGWAAGEGGCGGEGINGSVVESAQGKDKRAPDGDNEAVWLVRGATTAAGNGASMGAFHPGDQTQIDGVLSWEGSVGGFWSKSVAWIYCRPEPGHEAGCWRPVESGTCALADGASPSMGQVRAKRVRCLEGSIVRPLAVAFVKAVIDTLVEAAHEEQRQAVAEEEPPHFVAKAQTPVAEEQLLVTTAIVSNAAEVEEAAGAEEHIAATEDAEDLQGGLATPVEDEGRE